MKYPATLHKGLLVLSLGLAALPASADDDCDAPLNRWQSRDAVHQMAAAQGWQIQRLKIDDGCYEIRGTDKNGRGFKAKIEEIGKAGHEVRPSLMIPGIMNLSRPVFGHNGQIVAALTVPYMGQRSNPTSVEQADAALAQKAEALSIALGHSST